MPLPTFGDKFLGYHNAMIVDYLDEHQEADEDTAYNMTLEPAYERAQEYFVEYGEWKGNMMREEQGGSCA